MSNKPAGLSAAADSAAAPDAATLLDDPQEWPAFGRPHGKPAADVPPTQTTWESHVVLEATDVDTMV